MDATSTVKNSDTEKWEFSDYGMKLMELDHGILVMTCNLYVVIFGVGNSWSSSYTDNCKNNYLAVGEGLTHFRSPEKEFIINFSKPNTKFCVISLKLTKQC